jgi:hypothetical protein
MTPAIQIPVDYLMTHTHLDWGDVLYGIENGFISSNDAVKIAIERVSQNDDANETEVELAGLLRSEVELRGLEIVRELSTEKCDVDAKSIWLYLLLAWLFDHKAECDDPLRIVEQIYADFDYPEEISAFVRYMPPQDGYRPQDHSLEENRERLFGLWHEYLTTHQPLR